MSVECPRCGKSLTDPNGLAWCQGCGYCKLAEADIKMLKPKSRQSNPLTATSGAVMKSPVWVWVALFGAGAIIVATVVAEREMRLSEFQRALFATVQIVAGLALMFIGQFVGLMRVAPEETSVGLKDAIVPVWLYPVLFKHLPITQVPIYLIIWGLTAVITASVVVGGVGHWFTYLPNKSRPYEVVKLPKG